MRRRNFIFALGQAATLSVLRPLAVQAQPAKTTRIAYLALLPGENTTLAKALMLRLQELGYREGQNMVWHYRSAEGQADRLPRLAAELVEMAPDVLIAGFGTLAPKAAIAATRSIPIVFTGVGDPVGAGLIKSLREPGGNATGVSALASDITAKRLQLLDDLLPGKKLVAVLGNPDTPFTALALDRVGKAAALMGVPLKVIDVRTAAEIQTGIAQAIEAKAVGMMLLEDPVLLGAMKQTVDLVAQARLPAVFGLREYTVAGGLASYGPDQNQMSRRAADYVDRILKGASPASLPVEQPTKFELVINLNAAKGLGLSIPPGLLASADEVIE